jgi:hypothetical protein
MISTWNLLFSIKFLTYSSKIVRTIKVHSQCCIDNLISPIDTIEQDYQVFSPKIPDGLHIHFVIKNNLLVITSEHVTAVHPDFIDKVMTKGSSSDKEYVLLIIIIL